MNCELQTIAIKQTEPILAIPRVNISQANISQVKKPPTLVQACLKRLCQSLDDKASAKLPSTEQIQLIKMVPSQSARSMTLANGVQIIFDSRVEKDASVPTAYIELYVKTGFLAARTEAERHLAHFVEHLPFLGTESYSQKDIEEILHTHGCTIGADTNASTWTDATLFYINKMLTDDFDNIVKCMKMIYEFSCKASFAKDLVEKEWHVVNEELKMRDEVNYRSLQRIVSRIEKNPYYLERMKYELDPTDIVNRARQFYREWYQPQNMIITCVGDFTGKEEATLKTLCTLFGSIPVPEKTNTLIKQQEYECLTTEKKQASSYVVIPYPEADTASPIHVCNDQSQKYDVIRIYRQLPQPAILPPTYVKSVSFTLVDLLKNAVASMNRLYLAKPDCPSVTMKMGSMVISDCGREWAFAEVDVQSAKFKEAYRFLLQQLKRVQAHALTQSHLDYAKAQSRELRKESPDRFSNKVLGEWYRERFVQRGIVPDMQASLQIARLVIESITLAHFEKKIQDWNLFSDSAKGAFSTLVMGQKVPQGLESALKEVFENEALEPVVIEKELDLADQLSRLSVQEKDVVIELKTHVPPIESPYKNSITTLQLKNGLQVFLAPTTDEKKSVKISWTIPCPGYGDEIARHAHFIAELILNKFALTHLTLALGKYGISPPNISTPALHTSLALVLLKESNLLEGLNALAYLFEAVKKFDVSTIESYFQANLADHRKRTEQGLNNPDFYSQAFYFKRIYGHMKGQDIYDLAFIDRVTPEMCLQALQNILGDLAGVKLLVCGNFQVQPVVELVQKTMGGLQTWRRRDPAFELEAFVFPKSPFPLGATEKIPTTDTPDKARMKIVYPIPTRKYGKEDYQSGIAQKILQMILMNDLRRDNQLIYSCSSGLRWPWTKKGDHLLVIDLVTSAANQAVARKKVIEAVKKAAAVDRETCQKYLSAVQVGAKKAFDSANNKTAEWLVVCEGTLTGDGPLADAFLPPIWNKETTVDDILRILGVICDIDNKPSIEVITLPQNQAADTTRLEDVADHESS